mmetsp:Transcript_36522/g.36942  ORF Transcript_36522/g.36942 Transcript_36522/m.36942 type:complete len:90 (-) Transcript_36522:201-470(-)
MPTFHPVHHTFSLVRPSILFAYEFGDEAGWRQRGWIPNMRCVREDDGDGDGGGDDDRARGCDRAGYDDFINWCVKREQNELGSSIDQIV